MSFDAVAASGVVERLSALHPKKIDLSTGRIERLLLKLGSPHLSLPRVVHVAGTNGKGSTIAFMRAGLEAAGWRVNVYTSPHLVRFTERVRLADGPISEAALLAALDRAEAANDGAPITFFEILTASAFLAFSEAPADATLIEVGLGGRYDATNVFPRPELSVITPVSIDHVDFLGDDLGRIAWEKAGVLKAGVPAIVAPQAPKADGVIRKEAADVGALPVYGDDDWHASPSPGGMTFAAPDCAFDLPRPALAGGWQVTNAGTALAALNMLEGFALNAAIAAKALERVEWPGRLQILARGRLADLAAPRALWLDGAHNVAAAAALAETLIAWPQAPRLVVGMLNTKDADAYFKALAPVGAAVFAAPIPNADASTSPTDIAAAAGRAGLQARAFERLDAAVAAAAEGGGTEPVVITGSLRLVGAVLHDADAALQLD